jgi:plastocyanin
MRVSAAIFIGFAQLFTAVHSLNHQVLVGQNNSLLFQPDTVRAFPGDTVEFLFAGLVSFSSRSATLPTMLTINNRTTRLHQAALYLPASPMAS